MTQADEPPVKRAVAFIDGQNLYHHAKAAFGHHHPNYDPTKLLNAVCGLNNWVPAGIRFYTGIPSATHAPMWHGYWANRLLSMTRSGVLVVQRPIRYHQEQVELPDGTVKSVVTPQEKGIDVRLALDVIRLARQNQYDVAIIFSQDQDLAEVVQEVKDTAKMVNRWIRIACAFPSGPQATSKRGINGADWIKMEQAFYDACIDPHDYRPQQK